MTGRRFSAEWLDEITAPAEKWRRRCNGYPAEGILITARSLRVVLVERVGVSVNDEGVISWTDGSGRQFTAAPVRD
jgi:hypothetical protein